MRSRYGRLRSQAILKYGESGSDEEEPEDGTGAEAGSEEDDEEGPMPPIKRQKTTSPLGRGTPPKRWDGVEQGPETIPVTMKGSSEDPFPPMVNALGNIRADWEVKRRLLVTIARLVGALVNKELSKKVAEKIADPVEMKNREAEVRQLKEEVTRLMVENDAVKERMNAMQGVADETEKVAKEVKAIIGDPGSAVIKAKLLDAGLLQDKKVSGTKIVRILEDYTKQVEDAMSGARKATDRMVICSQKFTGASCSKAFGISDLSLPDFYPEGTIPLEGKAVTPQLKKSVGNQREGKPSNAPIEIESSPSELPRPSNLERNRNLEEVFNQLGSEMEAPTPDSGDVDMMTM